MKTIPYFVAGLLLISGFAAIGLGDEAGEVQKTINVDFSDIQIIESNEKPFLGIRFNGADGCIYKENEPILPLYSTLLTFPFGTDILSVKCQLGQISTMDLSNKVVPAPTHVHPGIDDSNKVEYVMDEVIYNSDELYPNEWFDFHKGAGLNEDGEHTIFLVVRGFPVQYSPGTDTIQYVNNMEFTVTYVEPDGEYFPQTTDYELVIIAPEKFENNLNKLVTHKNNMGVTTILKTTEDIYSEYTGYDRPEQIKYFIKDAIETWNTKYVMLVGGLNSYWYGIPRDNKNAGVQDWYVPVRYTNLQDQGSLYDPGFLSDLYYADIYDGGSNFDDWDSNNNNVFAEWKGINKDILDFYPDVYVGRLACRNKMEVKVMVNKIINYEDGGAYGSSWYNKIIYAGGDSFDDTGTNYLEGEVVSERIANDYMTEFIPTKLYASNKVSNPKLTPTGTNLKREVRKGAGHLFLDGHASPFTWTTHWPGEFEGPESWTERFWILDFPMLLNGGKTPICAVEGCHNSQFNVSIKAGLDDPKDGSGHMWLYGAPVPECWSWWLARKIGGGSLATTGNTGLGYGAVGENGDLDGDGKVEPDILEAFGGFYFDQYYEVFDGGADKLGDVHSGALTTYLNVRPGMGYNIDAKTMEQMALLGDPSLKIGGYPAAAGVRVEIIDADAGVLGAPLQDIMFQATATNVQGDVTYTWDFDNDGQYDDAEGEIVSESWTLPGVYWISLKATDGTGQFDTYDTIVGIEFGADKPAKPSGETNVKPGVEYTYTSAVNTQGGYWNQVLYKFSWGDGTETGWIETPSASHTWEQKGTFKVKAKALLTHESEDNEDFKETEWSEPLTVKLSRSKATQPTIFELLKLFFEKYPNAFPLLRHLLGL